MAALTLVQAAALTLDREAAFTLAPAVALTLAQEGDFTLAPAAELTLGREVALTQVLEGALTPVPADLATPGLAVSLMTNGTALLPTANDPLQARWGADEGRRFEDVVCVGLLNTHRCGMRDLICRTSNCVFGGQRGGY